jgi:hypothetical protein
VQSVVFLEDRAVPCAADLVDTVSNKVDDRRGYPEPVWYGVVSVDISAKEVPTLTLD